MREHGDELFWLFLIFEIILIDIVIVTGNIQTASIHFNTVSSV